MSEWAIIVHMMTLRHEHISHITGPVWEESPVAVGSFTMSQWSFDDFFLCQLELDGNQSRWLWTETPCRSCHDDVMKWKLFSASLAICAGNWPVPLNSPHKGQWRRALMFSLICVWINGWVNNREGGDLRRHRAHYDVIVMRRQGTESCTYAVMKCAP